MFDRDIDMISPFCVNQNYEGLLDEFFGIKTCSISVANTIVYPDEDVRKQEKIADDQRTDFILSNQDTIFHEVRNKHFDVAGTHFNKKIEKITQMMADKDQRTIEELDKFIKELKEMDVVNAKKIATCHINVAYFISECMKDMDYIQVYKFEQTCIMAEKDEMKFIGQSLEAKMVK